MKRAFCVIAGACSLLGWAPADEAGMKNALADWQMRQSDWESAFKTAESDGKREELMKSRPDAVPVARELWRQVGRDLQKPETQKPYLLPTVLWFLDHPEAVAQAFPNGESARKIVVLCLDALENTLFREKGAGKAAYALSNSRELRCRVILEQIKDYSQFPEDQGLAALGLAMVMKETTGMLQDDVRLVAARGKLLKDAIIKCYDSSFGPVPVRNLVQEELYEIRNLNIGQTGPGISLPSSTTGAEVKLPGGEKPVLVVFWDPRDARSVQFLGKAASLRGEFPGLTVMPVAPGSSENVKKALLNLNLDIPSLIDEKAAAFKDYRVRHTPQVYLLDPKGKILMRGTPDMLFDANLYAVMGKFEGKKNGKAEDKKAPAAPPAARPAPLPAKINSPETRVPAVPQPAAAPAAPLAAPPLRPMPE
ncbi:redoxin domain-containing protein [Akkermansia muciniphila]|uniref:peroxiredoxin family protein n=1 Tax=Akkermansia muciniphila TaxID=239935 RepID=UPI0033B9809F